MGVLLLAALASAAQAQDPPPESPKVEDVVVTGARAEVETAIDRRSYSVAKDLAAQSGSAADALRNIPSVQLDAQGNPSLLGQGNVTILIDGQPSSQFIGGNLGQSLQAMPADQIDRIEVMTNPPVEYRVDGGGGIINLVMKNARGAGRSGSARLRAGSRDSAWAGANMGYNSDRMSVTGDLSGRRLHNSDTIQQTLDRRGSPAGAAQARENLQSGQTTNTQGQGHLGVDYDFDPRTRLSGSLRYSASRYAGDTLVRMFEGDPRTETANRNGDEDQIVARGEAALTLRRTFAEGRAVTLHTDHKSYHKRYERLDLSTQLVPPGQPRSGRSEFWNDNSPRTTLTADYEAAARTGKLKLGYDFEYAPKHTDHDTALGPADGPLVSDPLQHGRFYDTETINEAYVSYERTLGPLTVVAGLRGKGLRLDLDQQDRAARVVHDYVRLYPNFRAAYQLDETRRVTFSASRRTNVPYSEQLDPLPLSQSPFWLTAGNPGLKPEDAYSADLSFETRNDGRLMIATLFYRETRDAFSVLITERPDGAVLETTVNAGAIRSAGAEWALNRPLTKTLSYSVSLDTYWTEIRDDRLGVSAVQSSVTGFGRASLNWQATAKDLFQVNVTSTGKVLRPQGYTQPTYWANVGYRHAINDKASLTLVVDDPLEMLKYRSAEVINGVENHRLRHGSGRTVSLALVWTFAGKAKAAGFDLGSGDGGR